MSIRNVFSEISELKNELKGLNKRANDIRKRLKVLETEATDFIEKSGDPGVKYKDSAFIVNDVKIRKPKKTAEKSIDVANVLTKHGVRVHPSVITELIDSVKGSETICKKLKIQTLN